MNLRRCLFVALSTFSEAAQLYASHYSGSIYQLTLSGSGSSYSLTQTSSIVGCGSLPSWVTYDNFSRALYCSDEVMYGTGDVTAFSIGSDGHLTQSAKASAIYGAVANVLYGGTSGNSFLAIAHYQASTISTFKLPLTSSSTALQTFKYSLSKPGAVPSRQDAPHPHHVVVDPTGGFIVAPDLGADLLRLYSINKSSGQLTECPAVTVPPGTGPRHATFYTSGASSRIRRQTASTTLYVANELGNSVSVFSISYSGSGCPSVNPLQTLTPYSGNATAPTGTKVAEVRVKGNYLYSSNRNDKKFSPNDSMTSYTISSSGSLTWQAISSSGGTYPRTFAINKAGDLVAIGDQTTANVAIVTRDASTGKLGSQVASLRISSAGTPENENGLSSVVWAE